MLVFAVALSRSGCGAEVAAPQHVGLLACQPGLSPRPLHCKLGSYSLTTREVQSVCLEIVLLHGSPRPQGEHKHGFSVSREQRPRGHRDAMGVAVKEELVGLAPPPRPVHADRWRSATFPMDAELCA